MGSMVQTVASIIPTSLASMSPTTKATNTVERFQQCKDPVYEKLNIGADLYCNVRYGLSEEELAMDPIENANWMASNGHISADLETGEAVDNDQPWNYKKFLEECANRTVGWGENEKENEGDGSNCLSPQNEAMNKHFRIYTVDLGVADYMDGDTDDTGDAGGSESGSTGDVDQDGWAYPTTKNAVTTSGYKPPSRPTHRGLDLAQPGNAMGEPIFAARDGKVVASGPASGFGNWIVLLHENVNGKTYSTVYGHMKANDLMVRRGDTVKAGQQIARIGSEGQSSGPHLHFEIWEGDVSSGTCSTNNGDCSIDPTAIMDKAKGASPSSPDPRRNV
jgi:murein DD-endopeptidase MepM/ murein hydrolase activator NlpD